MQLKSRFHSHAAIKQCRDSIMLQRTEQNKECTCEQQLVLRNPLHWFQQVVFQGQAGTPRTHLRKKNKHKVVFMHGCKCTDTEASEPVFEIQEAFLMAASDTDDSGKMLQSKTVNGFDVISLIKNSISAFQGLTSLSEEAFLFKLIAIKYSCRQKQWKVPVRSNSCFN